MISLCFLLLLRWTSTDDFRVGQELCCKPCKITTHFYYPQMFVSGTPSPSVFFFFFCRCFSGHFRFIRFRLWCTCRSTNIAVTITIAGDRGTGDRVAKTSARGLLVLVLTPETTTTNLSIVSLVSKEAQISRSNDVAWFPLILEYSNVHKSNILLLYAIN